MSPPMKKMMHRLELLVVGLMVVLATLVIHS